MAKGIKTDKPNILVIWGDDIGQSNLSCYTKGVMGYLTANIDRIAKEGMIFTDFLPIKAKPPVSHPSSPASADCARAAPTWICPVPILA